MSNLVETPQPWTPPTQGVVIVQKPQNGGVVAPIQARQDTPSIAPVSPPSAAFREYRTLLHVFFKGKLSGMKDCCIVQKMDQQIAESAFRPTPSMQTHNIPIAVEQNNSSPPDLTKAIITAVDIRSTHNDFPVAVRFTWTGQTDSANGTDFKGMHFPLQLHPGESTRGATFNVYDARNAINDPLLLKYGHVDMKTMWSQIQIVKSPGGSEFALVPPTHDALKLIKLNPQKFGEPPGKNDIVEGMFKMSPTQIGRAIDEMYTNVLSRFIFTDLTKFSVQMYREDGKPFNDISGTSWDHFDQTEQDFLKEKTLTAGFEMIITWASPQTEKANLSLTTSTNVISPASSNTKSFQKVPTA